jgi:hypothetical protein
MLDATVKFEVIRCRLIDMTGVTARVGIAPSVHQNMLGSYTGSTHLMSEQWIYPFIFSITDCKGDGIRLYCG